MTFSFRLLRVTSLVLPLFFVGTAGAANTDHLALLEAYITAWNNGEVEALDAILAPEFIRHGNYGKTGSRAEMKQRIEEFRGFYRDLHIEVQDSFAGDNKGAMRWRFRGGYGDTSFTMNSVNFAMYRFANGQIAEEWVVGNTTDFWTSMGYTIMPPGTKMIPPEIEQSEDAESLPPPVDPAPLAASIEAAQRDAPPKRGTLEITTDTDCHLALDGKEIGWLAAHEAVVFPLAKGGYRLTASSRAGSTFYRETVEIRKAKVTRAEIRAPGRVVVHPQKRTTEDLHTGLMWQITDNGSDISQTAANRHCEDQTQGGYTDWRLPSIFELERLYDPGSSKRFKTIPGISLSGCCPWTTTPHGEFHWTFVFYNGLRYIKYRSIAKFSRALCVRNAWDAP